MQPFGGKAKMKKTVMYTETRAWFFELDLS